MRSKTVWRSVFTLLVAGGLLACAGAIADETAVVETIEAVEEAAPPVTDEMFTVNTTWQRFWCSSCTLDLQPWKPD